MHKHCLKSVEENKHATFFEKVMVQRCQKCMFQIWAINFSRMIKVFFENVPPGGGMGNELIRLVPNVKCTVQISKFVCLNCKVSFSKLLNVFVQTSKCIFKNCVMYLSRMRKGLFEDVPPGGGMSGDNWLVIIGCNYQDSGTSLPWRTVQLVGLLPTQHQMGSARQMKI